MISRLCNLDFFSTFAVLRSHCDIDSGGGKAGSRKANRSQVAKIRNYGFNIGASHLLPVRPPVVRAGCTSRQKVRLVGVVNLNLVGIVVAKTEKLLVAEIVDPFLKRFA